MLLLLFLLSVFVSKTEKQKTVINIVKCRQCVRALKIISKLKGEKTNVNVCFKYKKSVCGGRGSGGVFMQVWGVGGVVEILTCLEGL